MLRASPVWVLSCALAACRPGLPAGDKPTDDDTEPPVTDTDVGDSDVDSDPPGPCDVTEVEPNDAAADGTPLPLEVTGCGGFQSEPDGDHWRFDTVEEGWLAVDVTSLRIGSRAQVTLALSGPGVNVGVTHWEDLPEVRFRMPVGPGAWQALVRQRVGTDAFPGRGADFFYEVRASSSKAPLDWDVEEGVNEAWETPQVLDATTGAVTLFGGLSGQNDEDWYRVDVPAGRHRVVLDVDAHHDGSAMDPVIRTVDGDGDVVDTVTTGQLGWEADPWTELFLTEATTLVFEVADEGRQHGAATWYVLRVSVEAE